MSRTRTREPGSLWAKPSWWCLARVVPHFPAVAAAAVTPGGYRYRGLQALTTGMLGSEIDLQQRKSKSTWKSFSTPPSCHHVSHHRPRFSDPNARIGRVLYHPVLLPHRSHTPGLLGRGCQVIRMSVVQRNPGAGSKKKRLTLPLIPRPHLEPLLPKMHHRLPAQQQHHHHHQRRQPRQSPPRHPIHV